MPQIVQQSSLNLTALVVPDLYVVIQTPQQLSINGVPTNVIGVVGTATWGPVNKPVGIGTMAAYASNFGAVQARKYDMGTHVATAVQQGASAFVCVRVTDGTDTAATAQLQVLSSNYAIQFTCRNTGTLGNSLVVNLTQSAIANAYRFTIGFPNQVPEVYDGIPLTGTNYPAFWNALVTAINTGLNQLRGPSNLVVATIGTNLVVPTVVTNSTPFTGGTDGVTTITDSVLIGSNSSSPETGMYALANQGCSIGVLADTSTSTSWTTQEQFGETAGVYMMLTGPSGDTIANAITTKQTAGLAGYGAKLLFGDYLYWVDQANNGIIRLVSPQGFVAGRLANLSPEQSSLNKPIYGIVGSQSYGVPGSNQVNAYSTYQLTQLFSNGIDVVSNPQPGGSYWGCRYGHNSSLDPRVDGDNYTRLTNYITATLAAGMGFYVGEPINNSLLQAIRGTQLAFLQNLVTAGVLAPQLSGALPYSVVCDSSNNPFSLTSLGYVTSTAQVQYQAINEKFIVNVMGGQTVSVSTQLLPS